MAKTPPPLTFRLYPERNSSLFCRVTVCRNKADMLAYLESSSSIVKEYADRNRDATAIAAGGERWRVLPGRRMRKSGEFCEIICHRVGLTLEILSHEVTHATFRWAARIGLDVGMRNQAESSPDCSDEEERFCYALGRMTNTMAWRCMKRGIWRRPMCNAETFDPDDID